MNKETGGPAFPFSSLEPEGPAVYKDNEGMTLLDYFAGQALSGLLGNPALEKQILKVGQSWIEEFAWAAADAMLQEREVVMRNVKLAHGIGVEDEPNQRST